MNIGANSEHTFRARRYLMRQLATADRQLLDVMTR